MNIKNRHQPVSGARAALWLLALLLAAGCAPRTAGSPAIPEPPAAPGSSGAADQEAQIDVLADAIAAVQIGASFHEAVQLILDATDRDHGALVVSGLGKSSYIAQKLSATFASLGITSMPPLTKLVGAGCSDGSDNIEASIADYGVIMYFVATNTSGGPYDIYLYKHSASTSAPASPIVSTTVEDVTGAGATEMHAHLT